MSRRTRRCVDDSRPRRPSARVRSRGHASKLCATVREGVGPRGHAATLMAGTVQTSIPGTSSRPLVAPDRRCLEQPGRTSMRRLDQALTRAWLERVVDASHAMTGRGPSRNIDTSSFRGTRLRGTRQPSRCCPSVCRPSVCRRAGLRRRPRRLLERARAHRPVFPPNDGLCRLAVPGTNRAIDPDAVDTIRRDDAIRRDGSLEILAQKIICNPAIPLGMRSSPD
jgi:hypothetical protein